MNERDDPAVLDYLRAENDYTETILAPTGPPRGRTPEKVRGRTPHTGATARAVREMLPRAHFATLYAKPRGLPVVDTFVTAASQTGADTSKERKTAGGAVNCVKARAQMLTGYRTMVLGS